MIYSFLKTTGVSLVALAASGTFAATAEEMETTAPDPAIWSVSDADTTIYLFGTVHILQKDVAWRNEAFNTAWESADTVYFETDISAEAQAALQPLIFELGLNPEGTTLSSFFTEEELALIETEATPLGLPLSSLQPFRPWLASLTIGVMRIVADGGDPEAGLEMILGKEAVADEKNLRFFETGEQQLRFFADLPDEMMADMLIEGIQQTNDFPNFFNDMVSAWQAGDMDRLGDMINGAMQSSDGTIADVLLYKRNANWADTLETVLNEEAGTFFVAVGAGHLAGEKSLQDYLAEKGIEAERL
ncbi:TraB/GumN family protein [Parvularcula sp. IMCC14364]|uniref:TraB/GumN family protein n=1 Tax=Parvularcula sp. IMCC14364 TaxID=3067902 RepID=UPI0027409A63|nr:TraB/GumN family protein [Parvularcula sp. IMCC14364]